MSASLLVVETDTHLRRFVASGLRSEGFEVVDVGDASAALSRLGETRIDVAVVDVLMTGADGCTLARTIQHHHPGVALLLVTTKGMEGLGVTEHCGLRVAAVVTKPFTVEQLLAALHRATNGHSTAIGSDAGADARR